MKILNYWSTSIIASISLAFLWGCSSQYDSTKAITETSAFPRAIERAKKDKRYLVMHSGVDIYRIASVQVEKSKQQFTVHLNKVDSLHLVNMYKPSASVEKFMHLYMSDSTSYTLDEPHTILLNKVARIELVD